MDLINLNASEVESSNGPKLPPPLIPTTIRSSENVENLASISPIAHSATRSVGYESPANNPFDVALVEALDIAKNQNDPFEVVLQKALKKQEAQEVSTARARGVAFKDDFTPSRGRHSNILKMNKSMDSSLARVAASRSANCRSPCADSSIIEDLNNTNLLADGQGASGILVPHVLIQSPSRFDSSVLNYSAMDDSLTESSGNAGESLLRSIAAKKFSLLKEEGAGEAVSLGLPKQKQYRSLSQSARSSPKKSRLRRSQSIVDNLRPGMDNSDGGSIGGISSVVSEDNMNKAFLESRLASNSSIITDLSNISAITRLDSASSVSSYGFANRAFTENSAYELSGAMNSIEKSHGPSLGNSRPSTGASFGSIFDTQRRDPLLSSDNLADLLSKFARLRVKSSIGGSDASAGADKLVDVAVFRPATEDSPPPQSQRESVSSISSDSVFLDSSRFDESIAKEAKRLARTFEKLANTTNTSSSCGSSDLVNSLPPSNIDALPVTDDEAPVADLIELPNSPPRSDARPDSDKIVETKSASSEAKSEKSMLRDLENQFVAPREKKMSSAFLIELEDLLKSNGNQDTAELLARVQQALGVQPPSNSELLASCLATTNDSTETQKKTEPERETESMGNDSCEDNINAVSSENNVKRLSPWNDKRFHNNLNNEKEMNKSDHSLKLVTEENGNENSLEDHDDPVAANEKEEKILNNRKIAVDFIVGLGKLFNAENGDSTTANVLKDLSTVLNIAASKSGVFDNGETSAQETKRAFTPVKSRVATPPRKSTPLSAFSRSANRRSLDSSTKVKTPGERVMKRSVTGVQTPTTRHSMRPLSAEKSKIQVKDVKPCSSSNSSSANVSSNFKRSPSINKKTGKDTSQKPASNSAIPEKTSSTVADAAKSKFRKKIDTEVTNKKGPMKALIPVGHMQRQGKRVPPLTGSVTPTKPACDNSSDCKIAASTPCSAGHHSVQKKSPRTKPVASSTPDGGAVKNARRSAPPVPQSPGNSILSCNISPVTSKSDETENDNSKNEKDNSKSTKLSGPATPSKSRAASLLPKFSPMRNTKISPIGSPRGLKLSESQPANRSLKILSPKPPAITVTDVDSGPLNESNKIASKVKPLNLISKLRRRSGSVTDKENKS